MRIGVIGLGSMGKRRVRDLRALGHDVVGFDPRAERRAQAVELFGATSVTDFAALIDARPDALVISTPPDQHLEYYERAFAARVPFFSEMNVHLPPPAWFAAREAASGVRGYPSATWQFYPLFGVLREQLRQLGHDQVNTVHYHYGGYLPLWHPWERYDEFYAGSRRRVAAAREMVPFELEWMRWVFGPVRSVCCMHDRRSEWTTDIDDTYLLLLDFESGLRGSLFSEVHQVAPFRTARVSCRRQSFLVDMSVHELRRYDLDTDSWRLLKPPGLRSLGLARRGFLHIPMSHLAARVPFLFLFQVIRIIAGLDEQTAFFKSDYLIANAIQEIAIMAYDQHRAVEVRQSFLQHAQAGKVEIISRFIEH